MSQRSPTSAEEAILELRRHPSHQDMLHDAYLSGDVAGEARRFANSAEFEAVIDLLEEVAGKTIVDLGAGTGIASWAFATRGAEVVYAVEPDPSGEVGRGAINKLIGQLPISVLDAGGEAIPISDQEADVVYLRQVLHHIGDLGRVLAECGRVLKPGGLLLATREHVVKDEKELSTFLQNHPVHALVGGEYAFPLRVYLEAFARSGLNVDRVIAPWESVINAYPIVASDDELKEYPRRALERKYGWMGTAIGSIPPIAALIRRNLFDRVPGRMYSFLASKP